MNLPQHHTPPAFDSEAFHCPHCRVYANQTWYYVRGCSGQKGGNLTDALEGSKAAICASCNKWSFWQNQKMFYPDTAVAEPPNADLPDDVVHDYNEARSILSRSPRGAAALLRLAIQKLCKELGKPGQNINQDIKALVADGLPAKVQESLDAVRVIGNNAVHPGQIDLKDDRKTASALFKLVNFVATKMITEPKEIDELYASLPETQREAIENRDRKNSSK